MLSSVLGTLATIMSLIITVGLVTQALLNRQRKSCEGVSPFLIHVIGLAYLSWVLYELSIFNWFIVVAETPGLIMSVILVYQLYKFGPMPKSEEFWNKLLGFLKPDIMVDRFAQIVLFGLNYCGPVNLIIDVDNTLALPDSDRIDKSIVCMLIEAKNRRVVGHIVLVSNIVVPNLNRQCRVERIAKQINARGSICAVLPFVKPFSHPIRRALAMIPGATSSNTIVIGDQWLTDGLAAKWARLRFILVKPLGGEKIYTSWKRGLEKTVFQWTKWQ